MVTMNKNHGKKRDRSIDVQWNVYFTILPMAVLSILLLLLGHPESSSFTSYIFYFTTFILILSGVFCLISHLYWGSLLFLCGVAMLFFTLDTPWISGQDDINSFSSILNGFVFITDCLIFFSYLAIETFKRIDRTLIPALQSGRERKRVTQITEIANRQTNTAIPDKATRRRWRRDHTN